MLFSLGLSGLLNSGVVDVATIEQGLSYEQCVAEIIPVQEFVDSEVVSCGYYDIVATKVICIANKE